MILKGLVVDGKQATKVIQQTINSPINNKKYEASYRQKFIGGGFGKTTRICST